MKTPDVNLSRVLQNLRLSALEWVALVATISFVGVVTFYYLNSAQPLRSKLSDLRTREKKLQNQIVDDATKRKLLEEQRANREKILESLDSFEARLQSRKTGMTAIIDEVNQLAKAHHVRAGDTSFRSDAPVPLPGEAKPVASPGVSPSPATITQRDKLPVVYEGLGIDTTVEGDYHDLRRFMAALERSRNFIIINSITLQSVDERQRSKFMTGNQMPGGPATSDNAMPQPPAPAAGEQPSDEEAPGGPTKIIVALKIEMQTHFAREARSTAEANSIPAKAPAEQR